MDKYSPYSGYLWIVIIPNTTISRVSQLNKTHTLWWEFQTQAPHMTLYSAHVAWVPHQFVVDLLSNIRSLIAGQLLEFDSLEPFCSKFLFLNARYPVNSLFTAHKNALDMQVYLDPNKVMSDSWLDLTQWQRTNMKTYWHPLVLEDYKPHITLAYDLQKAQEIKKISIQHSMRITNVVLWRMWVEYGQLEEIVVR
jgi:2'-5' RNA ligase